MPVKLDDARAFQLARMLERYLTEQGHVYAARLMRRVMQILAVKLVKTSRVISGLKAATLAIALLFENPGISDVEIARRVGCSPKTLQRSPQYMKARSVIKTNRAGSATFNGMTGTD